MIGAGVAIVGVLVMQGYKLGRLHLLEELKFLSQQQMARNEGGGLAGAVRHERR